MNNRIHLTLTEEAITVLERRATERKRGELVSKLLVEYDKTLVTQAAINNLDERLSKVEDTLAALIADSQYNIPD